MGTRKSLLTFAVVLLLALMAATPASAVRRYSRYGHHKGHYRHIVWNPVLKGCYDPMLRQKEETDRLQLPRITDDVQLEEMVRNEELEPIGKSKAHHGTPA